MAGSTGTYDRQQLGQREQLGPQRCCTHAAKGLPQTKGSHVTPQKTVQGTTTKSEFDRVFAQFKEDQEASRQRAAANEARTAELSKEILDSTQKYTEFMASMVAHKNEIQQQFGQINNTLKVIMAKLNAAATS